MKDSSFRSRCPVHCTVSPGLLCSFLTSLSNEDKLKRNFFSPLMCDESTF